MKLHILFLVAFCQLAAFVTISTAQNGQYDVQLVVQSFNCDSNKLIVGVQARAYDMAHTFNMGDANYRFDYDPRLVRTPKIASQVHFSNLAPASDLNYGPQNLNGSSVGSTKGTISLNTFYLGVSGSARLVDTAWTTVSLISFDVVNGTDCFSLLWHDGQTFPSTNMSEVELLPASDYNLYVVASGGVYNNLENCFQTTCGSLSSPPTVTDRKSVV